MPDLPDHIREGIEAFGLVILILANLGKIISMQRNTKRWNGLGKALRAEKWAYVALFSWILLMDEIALFDHGLFFLAIAIWIVVTEVRVIVMTPHLVIRHRPKEPIV